MTVGKLYKIFVKDGAASYDIGVLIEYPGTGRFASDLSFLVDGKIRKYSSFWFEFKEHKGNE